MAILWAGTSLADYASTSSAAVNTTAGNKYANVAESVALSDSNGFVQFDLPSTVNDLWLSFYVMQAANFETRRHVSFLDTSYSTSNPLYTLEIVNSGAKPMSIKAWNGTSLSSLATAAGAWTLSLLQRIDIHIKRDASVGVADVWVNGVLQFTFSGNTNLFGSASGINRIVIGQFSLSSTVSPISAVIAADEDTRAMFMAQSKPTAAGGVQQWAGAFSSVNETGFDDALLIAESTVGELSTFTKTALPAAFNTGFNVQAVVLSARGQALAGFDVTGAFRIGGVNYQASDFNMTPGYKPQQIVVAQNPATSTAWTFSTADSAEIGVKLISG